MKIWFQNRRARERRDREGTHSNNNNNNNNNNNANNNNAANRTVLHLHSPVINGPSTFGHDSVDCSRLQPLLGSAPCLSATSGLGLSSGLPSSWSPMSGVLFRRNSLSEESGELIAGQLTAIGSRITGETVLSTKTGVVSEIQQFVLPPPPPFFNCAPQSTFPQRPSIPFFAGYC